MNTLAIQQLDAPSWSVQDSIERRAHGCLLGPQLLARGLFNLEHYLSTTSSLGSERFAADWPDSEVSNAFSRIRSISIAVIVFTSVHEELAASW